MSDFNKLTVRELKKYIEDNNVLTFNCKRKADYIQAIDNHLQRQQTLKNMTDSFTKLGDYIAESTKKIKNVTKLADQQIALLKSKDNKTTEDYEKLVSLMDARMLMMEDRV